MTHPENTPTREGYAYSEGRSAFDAGAGEDDCPYATSLTGGNGTDRVRWFTGYFDRRIQVKFGRMFAHYGLTYP